MDLFHFFSVSGLAIEKRFAFLRKTALIIFLSPSLLFAASENMFIDLDITSKSDNNINQAKLDTDSVEDTITSGSLLVGFQYPINNMNALALSAGLKAQQFQKVRSQDSKSALFNAAYIWQRSISYRAPLYQLSVSSEIHNNNTRQQDSTIVNAQFTISSRITDVISVTGGAAYKTRDSESTVYDLNDQRLFVSGDYAFTKKITAYSTVSFITGDTFSVIRPDTDEELYIALSAGRDNVQWDDAFNAEFPSQVTRWQAYRIDADTQVFALGLNLGFGHSSSFDLSYTHAKVTGEADADYQRDIISGSLLKRF